MTVVATPHPFSVAEYRAMGEAGILPPDLRTELLDGEVVEMAPIGLPHASTVARMQQKLQQLCGTRALVWTQNPVLLGAKSLPVPDLALLLPRDDFYLSREPTSADILLLVEVSDASLAFDRGRKLKLYAAAGVSRVWVVDVAGRRILDFREPQADIYAVAIELARTDSTKVPTVDLPVPVADLIG